MRIERGIGVVAQPEDGSGCVGDVRGPLAVEIGERHDAVARDDIVAIEPEPGRHPVDRQSAVERGGRGRKQPDASANPATSPDGSAVRVVETRYAVPEVPRLMTGVPGSSPRPRAAPMLSPVPGADEHAGRQACRGGGGRRDARGLVRPHHLRQKVHRQLHARQPENFVRVTLGFD
jgi:hypothetical protein